VNPTAVKRLVKKANLLREYLGDNGLPESLPLGVVASTVPSFIETSRIVKEQKKDGKVRPGTVAGENAAQGALEGALLAVHDRKLGNLGKRVAAYSALTGGTDAAIGEAWAEHVKKKGKSKK